MICLFFDIASHRATFAVVSEGTVRALKEVDAVVRDDELPALVEDTLHEAGISFKDLTNIACVAGPGGFTSLRVAVTYANVLADQLEVPVSGVNLSDLYSARCPSEDAVWIHSTKKQEVFVRGVSKESDHWSWPDPVHLSLEEAFESITSSMWCGELIDDHAQEAVKNGMEEVSVAPLPEVLPSFLDNLKYEKKQLAPWYGRNW